MDAAPSGRDGEKTPGQRRMAAAHAARRRNRENRYATLLSERGWHVTTPEGEHFDPPAEPSQVA
jgi:hypothetical protein